MPRRHFPAVVPMDSTEIHLNRAISFSHRISRTAALGNAMGIPAVVGLLKTPFSPQGRRWNTASVFAMVALTIWGGGAILLGNPRGAQAQDDEAAPIRVGAIAFKNAQVEERTRLVVVAEIRAFFSGRSGFLLVPDAELAAALQAKGVTGKVIKAKGMLESLGPLGLTQLVTGVLRGKRDAAGVVNTELTLIHVDGRFGEALKEEVFPCPGCTTDQLIERVPGWVRSFFAPPFKLYLNTAPDGATVKSGGRELGTTPLAVPLMPGPHTLTISKPGFQTFDVSFVMPADQPFGAEIPLSPEAEAGPGPEAGSEGAPATVVRPFKPRQREPERPPTRLKTWGQRTILLGTASALMGGGFTLLAFNRVDEANNHLYYPDRKSKLDDTAKAATTASFAAYGVGAALIVVGAVLMALDPDAPAEPEPEDTLPPPDSTGLPDTATPGIGEPPSSDSPPTEPPAEAPPADAPPSDTVPSEPPAEAPPAE